MPTIKVIYGDLKINVREINNHWWLDFYHNKKRVRKTTSLKANDRNLKHIKTIIIPEIVSALTGDSIIQSFEKNLTLIEFSNKYFSIYKDTVRNHVYERNYKHFYNHINPYFGKHLLIDIAPLELEEWQQRLLKKYKPSSVTKYRSILFSIFDKALQNDLIKINPLTRVKSPNSIKKKIQTLTIKEDENINPFSINEMKKILDNVTGNLYYVIFFMFYTGIRPGELIALTWDDIDYEKKRIVIEKTVVNGKVGDVKTQSSVRYIDILPQLEIMLKELYLETCNYNNLFISNFRKPFYSHDVLNLRFKDLLKKINIKERSLYNLRHTFASHMISNVQNGIDILWVSRMLGHKDLSITLQVYAKYIKDDDVTRFKKIDKIGMILDMI